METNKKTYVGNAYKNDPKESVNTETGEVFTTPLSYQLSLQKKDLLDMEPDKYGNIAISVAGKSKDSIKASQEKTGKENVPTHSVYISAENDQYKELQVYVKKDKILEQPIDDYGNINIIVRKTKMQEDMSNYMVFLRDGKYEEVVNGEPKTRQQFVGKGYDKEGSFGETRIVGFATKKQWDDDKEKGLFNRKTYDVTLDNDKLGKLSVNEKGYVNLAIVPYSKESADIEGNVTQETAYLVAENKTFNKNAEVVLSIDGNKLNASDQNPNKYTNLIVADYAPDNVQYRADMYVKENPYRPEMKETMSQEEIKAHLKTIDPIYVGNGYSNKAEHVAYCSSDLTPEGLTKAIERNQAAKVHAIVYHPNVRGKIINDSHFEKIKENETLSKSIIKSVTSAKDTFRKIKDSHMIKTKEEVAVKLKPQDAQENKGIKAKKNKGIKM